jgi:hypothetical protein
MVTRNCAENIHGQPNNKSNQESNRVRCRSVRRDLCGPVAGFRPAVRSGAHRGMVFGLVVTPAIIVGLWARNSAKTWSLFRLIALYVLFLVISAALFISGSMSNPQH